ncbi:neutral/alkaline non-lysosomal ceramidase N-terminal domain-containing protein [bacterium]|nr:neutral/alkaline non-lysosomal ceramidase N-terminal domain-containing protein [bacterium]
MKSHQRILSIITARAVCVFSGALLILFCPSRLPYAQGWKAGTAAVIVTPEQPAWMAGYGSRDKKSEGKIHDLYVKALALEDPKGNRAVILTADLIGINLDFSTRVKTQIEKQYGIPRKAILLNASHTHCGPEVRASDMPFYQPEESVREIEAVTAWVEKRYVEVIGNAIRNLKPANLTFSKAMPVPFAVCRRFPTPEGIVYRSGPSSYYTGGSRDDTVPVLRVSDTNGSIITILFGYTCHPITLAGYEFCGDYPGFAQRYIEEMYPGATAMFAQGCTGDLVPNARYQVEYAMGHGRALADAVKKALDGDQIPVTGILRFDYDEIPLDLQPLPDRKTLENDLKSDDANTRGKAAFFLHKLDNNEPVEPILPFPVQVLRIGNEVLMIGLGGEPVVDYAVRFKSEFLTQFTWVLGYCNYQFGYLPTWKVLKEGGYEADGAMRHMPFTGPFTDTVEHKVVEGVRRLVKNVSE